MDDRLMMLPAAERGRMNREIGQEIWRQKKEIDEKYRKDEIIQNSALPVYWPFGLPGGGAPNPFTIRRKKMRNHLPARLDDGPLPHLPSIRKRIKFSDPELRFQYHPDVRKSVDIHWRYGFPPEVKAAYRQDLERQMEEKRQRRVEQWRSRSQQIQCGMTTEFGRPGPGGQAWRHPTRVGMNFLHSLGWTGEKAFRRLEDQIEGKGSQQLMIRDKPHSSYTTPEEALTGGIELVPLMARRRSFKKSSHLPSCDVTNTAAIHGKEAWQDPGGPVDYLRDLDAQVSDKRGQAKAEKEEDVKTARKHFETWNSLWGRPGHGAPRAGGVKAKGHLGQLLYREPGVLWPADSGHKVR